MIVGRVTAIKGRASRRGAGLASRLYRLELPRMHWRRLALGLAVCLTLNIAEAATDTARLTLTPQPRAEKSPAEPT